MNIPYVIFATIAGLFLSVSAILDYTTASAQAQTAPVYELPRFRDVATASTLPKLEGPSPVQLLADADFAPFSFSSQNGPSGIAVDLALASCAEAKISCEVTLLPFAALLPAMAAQQGDVVISGLRIDAASLAAAEPTRPYFRTMGRFAVQSGSPLQSAVVPNFDGKRIGVLKNSAYETWLKTYYDSSEITSFDTIAEVQDGLRTGNVDAIFGDNLSLIYWVKGEASRNCCRLLDNAFSDFDHFSRNIAFLVRSDRDDLRAALDFGLDQLQINGTTNKVFNRYVPVNPW